jgi:hypothetical protein
MNKNIKKFIEDIDEHLEIMLSMISCEEIDYSQKSIQIYYRLVCIYESIILLKNIQLDTTPFNILKIYTELKNLNSYDVEIDFNDILKSIENIKMVLYTIK